MRRALRIGVAAAALAALAVCAPRTAVQAQDAADEVPLLPEPTFETFERAAKELAKKGRGHEHAELLDVLVQLGAPSVDVQKLRSDGDKALARTRKPADNVTRAVKLAREGASELAERLSVESGERQRRLAELILRLDDSITPAHEALGRVQHEGEWVPEWWPALLERRAEIQEALHAVRRLEIPIKVGESPIPLFQELYGKPGRSATCGDISLHSVHFSEPKIARMLRELLRACALSNFVRTGRLEVPPIVRRFPTVLLASDVMYAKAVDEAAANGGASARDAAEARQLSGYFDKRGYYVDRRKAEATIEAGLLLHTWEWQMDKVVDDDMQACLRAGHLDWIALSYLGTRMPDVVYTEETGGAGRDGGRTSDRSAEEEEERRTLLRLAQGGMAGSRAWMAYLAMRREDPAWALTFVDQIGKVAGNELIKATTVVDFLQELRRFDELLRGTAGKPHGAATMEAALGEPLADFESRWRAWIVPRQTGLVQLLEDPPESAAAIGPQKLLDYLDAIRTKGVHHTNALTPLQFSADLTDGCRKHALYLGQNPEQTAAWPDAHEEYPDKPGFTPEGSRAGLNAVIAPGVGGWKDAIESWMATYYHRLPLLDPGLLRIGWGLEGGTAVLDSGSFVAPSVYQNWSLWPPPDGRDVPRRFQPELPSPYPGEDQSAWGYPITVQMFRVDGEPELSAELFEGGSPSGTPVPCHVSTPQAPLNPELVPRGTLCLIPKQHLAAGTRYTVRVRGIGDPELVWTFTTGR